MKLNFRDMPVEEAPRYVAHWNMCEQRTSDYCFSVVWGLGEDLGTKFAYDESAGLYWIHQKEVGAANLAPVGNWRQDDWAGVIRERYGDEARFFLVPERLAEIWREALAGRAEMETTDDRGTWEYLYDIKALASLSGNKYMKKRNRVNQFRKNYDYAYEPITKDILPEVAEFQHEWCRENDCGKIMGLVEENHGIQRIFQNWEKIPNLTGGVIRINGKIIAYTVGETAGDMLVVHYEKASLEYGAAYQAINKEFLSHIAEKYPDIKTVNREEDMNDPGLRAAKMSYMPTGFLKECGVKIKFN